MPLRIQVLSIFSQHVLTNPFRKSELADQRLFDRNPDPLAHSCTCLYLALRHRLVPDSSLLRHVLGLRFFDHAWLPPSLFASRFPGTRLFAFSRWFLVPGPLRTPPFSGRVSTALIISTSITRKTLTMFPRDSFTSYRVVALQAQAFLALRQRCGLAKGSICHVAASLHPHHRSPRRLCSSVNSWLSSR